MNVWKRLKQDRLFLFCVVIIGIIVFAGIFAEVIAPHDPAEVNVKIKLSGASIRYPLGTDKLGRCILSRLIYGIRTTVFFAFLTMSITIIIGTVIGILAGFYQGVVDELIMRLCDVMLSFPSEVMILALVGMMGPNLRNVVIANILVKWPWYARMIRGSVLTYMDKNYIRFAKLSGLSNLNIIRKHIIPVIAGEIIVLATLDTGSVILNISALSFLGLGAQAPTAEWGVMLNEAKAVLTTHPFQMFAPGIAIMIVVAAFHFIGDSLQDKLNPKYITGRNQSCRF